MATARLPGIYFETVAPPAPALLPRMDIAAFAGFLPSGPIGLPFVVEDSNRFEEIFGTDLTLAWDAQAHQMLLAQTPPSVRTYFRNGGKRCWVLRLANNALANQWAIPGLLQVDALSNLQAGWVQARSEGSWSDDLAVNATLLEDPLPPGSLITTGATPHMKGLNKGDTAQLYYPLTQTWAYHACSDPRWFWFQSVQATYQNGAIGACGGSPPSAQPDAVTLLGPGGNLPLPFLSFCGQLNGAAFEMLLQVTRDVALTVQPGAWLQISLGGGTLLMQVENMDAAGLIPATGASELATLTSTLGWWVLDPDTAWAAHQADTTVQVSTVEFELWAMPLGAPSQRIANLGLAPDHLRFWDLLPTDATLYAPVVRPAPLPYAALSADIDHPRFPLAGSASTAIGLPLGMTTLVNSDFTQAASMPGGTALQRDGLANFDQSLFIDPRLGQSNSTTLLQDAYSLQYQAQTPSQPGGLFALLSIDEASMLAVPDATLNGWVQSSAPTQLLAPPDPLEVSEPDAGGNYVVSWAAVQGASGYLLQASSDPSFETAVTQQDAGPALSMSRQNSPACAEQLYYRASAYGMAGSGPWSMTGSVLLGAGDFFACNQPQLDAPQLVLLQEPNRILLDWIPSPGGYDGFTLEIADDPLFASGYTLYHGSETGFQYWQVPGPPSYFRVNTQFGGASSPWSNTVTTTPAPLSPWTANPIADPGEAGPLMLPVHVAMLRIAATRGDMVAILSMPASYRTTDAAAYPAQLAAAIAPTESGRILSYAAVYHPWLVVRDNTSPLPMSLRAVPPDGGVCGVIANTTLNSGAWIAPANVAFNNVLGLQPALTSDAPSTFDTSQINLISQQPEGFLIMGQDTLVTVEAELEPLNVRRLLILIRRLALREGVRYVFQNISPTFQRQVTRQFDQWMQQMLARGAFAGLSAADSYRVIADATVNTQDSMDQGRFIVQLQVAPSVPMRFLTVQLVQSSGQLTLTES
jgi:hypothetical protein